MERRMVPIERVRFAALSQLRHGTGSLGLEPTESVPDRRHPTRPGTLGSGRPAIVSVISG
jgi:hypothetical protein